MTFCGSGQKLPAQQSGTMPIDAKSVIEIKSSRPAERKNAYKYKTFERSSKNKKLQL